MTGAEFESLVIAEIYKQTRALNSGARFYYLRTLDGFEVDLRIETPEGYLAFEIKMAERISRTDAGKPAQSGAFFGQAASAFVFALKRHEHAVFRRYLHCDKCGVFFLDRMEICKFQPNLKSIILSQANFYNIYIVFHQFLL